MDCTRELKSCFQKKATTETSFTHTLAGLDQKPRPCHSSISRAISPKNYRIDPLVKDDKELKLWCLIGEGLHRS